ncbi:hypothetical protein M4D50_01140 [Rothia sp. p3-SID1597]|nr:hypothetical protein [Rothia sp. p3-SID1597]
MKHPTQTTIELPTDHPRPGTKHWVTQELTTPRPTTTRNVHLTTCPTCHAIILTGLNDDIAATRAQADPTTLNHTQAAIHATAGRTLYHLTTTPTAWRLYETDNPNHPPPILTSHHCHYPATGTPLLAPPTPTDPNQEPPF